MLLDESDAELLIWTLSEYAAQDHGRTFPTRTASHFADAVMNGKREISTAESEIAVRSLRFARDRIDHLLDQKHEERDVLQADRRDVIRLLRFFRDGLSSLDTPRISE